MGSVYKDHVYLLPIGGEVIGRRISVELNYLGRVRSFGISRTSFFLIDVFQVMVLERQTGLVDCRFGQIQRINRRLGVGVRRKIEGRTTVKGPELEHCPGPMSPDQVGKNEKLQRRNIAVF